MSTKSSLRSEWSRVSYLRQLVEGDCSRLRAAGDLLEKPAQDALRLVPLPEAHVGLGLEGNTERV